MSPQFDCERHDAPACVLGGALRIHAEFRRYLVTGKHRGAERHIPAQRGDGIKLDRALVLQSVRNRQYQKTVRDAAREPEFPGVLVVEMRCETVARKLRKAINQFARNNCGSRPEPAAGLEVVVSVDAWPEFRVQVCRQSIYPGVGASSRSSPPDLSSDQNSAGIGWENQSRFLFN